LLAPLPDRRGAAVAGRGLCPVTPLGAACLESLTSLEWSLKLRAVAVAAPPSETPTMCVLRSLSATDTLKVDVPLLPLVLLLLFLMLLLVIFVMRGSAGCVTRGLHR
jgi:hypothetical protein